MNKKIIVSILALAFVFSMPSSVGAIADATTTSPQDCHGNAVLWSWVYCSSNCKCNAGEGDCDRDSDCNTGYCAHNVGSKYGRARSMDVCETVHTTTTYPPIPTTTINPQDCHGNAVLWSWVYCSSSCKCNAGEGDCDRDSDCNTGYCAHNVGSKYGRARSMDVCETVHTTTTYPPIPTTMAPTTTTSPQDCHGNAVLWSWVYCSSNCKCNAGEGDCDRDSDCNTGYCAHNVGSKYGQARSMDVCETVHTTTTYPSTTTTIVPITKPSIRVISPNGGERLNSNQRHKITWSFSGKPYSHIDILVAEYNSSGSRTGNWKLIAAGVPTNQKYYYWTPSESPLYLSSNLAMMRRYKVKIREANDSASALTDMSNNPFYIVDLTHVTVITPTTTTSPQDCHGNAVLWSWVYCSSSCKCNAGEGDCDRDSDCNTGYCAHNVGSKYGRARSMDVCETVHTTTTYPPTTTTTTIPSTTSLPDLTISNITADKTTLNIGETTRILATERNIGNNSAGYHNTGIFENNIETPISSMEINTIAPGYGLIIDANYTCFRAGHHTITALTDFIHRVPAGEVAESNENNNSKTITINCIAPSTTTTSPQDCHGNAVLWSWVYCSSNCKCNAGEGDCDRDSDCNTGYCAHNVGSKYGQARSMDVCETVHTTTTYPPATKPPTITGATTWYTYKRCADGRCINHTTSVGPSADQCSTHADCTTATTTTGATTWYTYKRCTDGRCINHTTSVGPSADQCSTHADCPPATIIRLINSTLHRLSASLISLIKSLKTINK